MTPRDTAELVHPALAGISREELKKWYALMHLARVLDELPLAFNLGDNSSERAYVECDPARANLKSEIVTGCQQRAYASIKFNTTHN